MSVSNVPPNGAGGIGSGDIYSVDLTFADYKVKTIYTRANSMPEAIEKFSRYLVCLWAGRPWGEDADTFMHGVMPYVEDGLTVEEFTHFIPQ